MLQKKKKKKKRKLQASFAATKSQKSAKFEILLMHINIYEYQQATNKEAKNKKKVKKNNRKRKFCIKVYKSKHMALTEKSYFNSTFFICLTPKLMESNLKRNRNKNDF